MSQKTITYIKTFQVGQFNFDKIGIEYSFDLGEPDEACILELSQRVDAMAKKLYPWVFTIDGSVVAAGDTIEIPIIPKKKEEPPEDSFSLLDKIKNSTNPKELKSWELLIKVEKDKEKKRELQEAYDKKMDELTNKETV
jgi:hypothetical protein